MVDIEEIFRSILSQHDSIDIAESEFKMMVYDSPEMLSAYREWCRNEGFTEKTGFLEFCAGYLDGEDSIWETLRNDYD